MDNRDISDLLAETAELMELHGVNEFKTRSLRNAAFSIGRMMEPLSAVPPDNLEKINGIGKSISQKISEILSTGSLSERDKYLGETPAGVLEMMRIKGLGPKKVSLLWKELGIESPGELQYACNENRLLSLKGFGEKTQDIIRKALEFADRNKGLFHYAALEPIALQGTTFLKDTGLFKRVAITGDLRRKCEVATGIRYVVSGNEDTEAWEKIFSGNALFTYRSWDPKNSVLVLEATGSVPVSVHVCNDSTFAFIFWLTTGSSAHTEQIQAMPKWKDTAISECVTEEDLYASLGMQWIPPELREGNDESTLAIERKIPVLLEPSDLKGCLHNHSTWSDGIDTLRNMALACRDAGYGYFGICDHSKSAFYANGMSIERVLLQQKEIRELNKELAPFRIFSGIESDILPDGNLDYPPEILQTFDFVVASVHSGLRMTRERATERLLRAIANPYTTILGHPTGRLLLAREGYPIDHQAVLDACAQNGVVVELNAHPYRLDLDWRWIRYATDKGVLISINPDAHQVAGISDMYFGVCVARKGMLTAGNTFNALPLDAVQDWFSRRKGRH